MYTNHKFRIINELICYIFIYKHKSCAQTQKIVNHKSDSRLQKLCKI